MPATNPDGTYTTEFLLWEAKLAARVTGRDLVDAARHLRRVVGAPAGAQTAMVLGFADIKAATNPAVAAALTAHTDACAAYFVAMVDLADLDPTVDIRPLLPA
jgi:hypothetical protein